MRLFVERGMTTKEQLIDWMAANARLPAREYWDDQWVQTLLRPLAVAGVEPYAGRLKAAPDDIVQMFEPHEINIAVAGGEAQGRGKCSAPATSARSRSTPGADRRPPRASLAAYRSSARQTRPWRAAARSAWLAPQGLRVAGSMGR